MDSEPRVTIQRFGPADLAGAMLRKSFARRPNKTIFWPPAWALLGCALTAGLWPMGLLLRRLWLYASHQQFRAGELAAWLSPLGGHDAGATTATSAAQSARRIAPVFLIALAAICWLIAVGAVLIVAARLLGTWLGWLGSSLGDPRKSFIVATAIAAIAGASLIQIVAVMTLSMRMWWFTITCRQAGLLIHPRQISRDLPGWALWPMLLGLGAIPAALVALPWLAIYVICASFALLAAEVQRGYITVADRRLRIAMARAIGLLMQRSGGGR